MTDSSSLITVDSLLDFDHFLSVKSLPGTSSSPQTASWLGMRQCYSDSPVSDIPSDKLPSEEDCGHYLIKHLLKGGRGHFSPLEHNKLVVNVSGFPHNVMQQLRTHRTGTSFSVCSGRYTSKQILSVANDNKPVETAFYTRPPGTYVDRDGKNYTISQDDYLDSILFKYSCCQKYADFISRGYSEEHSRQNSIPWDSIRQPFVLGLNARSLMHILDLRSKADAQLEIRAMSSLLFDVFNSWMPEIADWYYEKRYSKALLAP